MERLLHERAVTLGFSLDLSTRKSYSSGLNAYLDFCEAHNLPISPSEDTLSFFVTLRFVKLVPPRWSLVL